MIVYVCILRYPARNAHVPYCYLWPVGVYYISPHYLKKNGQHQTPETRPQLQTSRKKRSWTPQGTMAMRRCRNRSNDLIHGGRWGWLFQKQHYLRDQKYRTQNVCYDFLYKFVSDMSVSKKNWARYGHKSKTVLMWSTHYFCHILIKLAFSLKFFEKYSNMKFHVNPSSGNGYDPCGRTNRRTDRNDEAKSRFSKLLPTPKNLKVKGKGDT